MPDREIQGRQSGQVVVELLEVTRLSRLYSILVGYS